MSWIRVDEKTFVGKPKRLNEIDKRPSDIRPSVVSIWWNGKDYLKGLFPYYPHLKEGLDPNSTTLTTSLEASQTPLHILSLLFLA